LDKLIELGLVRKTNQAYIANTDSLRSMIAKRRLPNIDN
jgi:ribosomal protein L30/L7E